MSEDRLIISLLGDKLFVWNSQDVLRLREKRIVGTLVGSLPRLPTQNNHLGLPLQLMAEQARLLVDLGVAQVVEDSEPRPLPSLQEFTEFKEMRRKLYERQIEICAEEKKKDIMNNMDKILEGKRAKKRREREAGGEKGDGIEVEDKVEFNVEDIKTGRLPEKSSWIQIKTASLPRTEYKSAVWQFPESHQEKLRYKVFKDLWTQGYYLTTGGKFGGDYLVYPGDPARYHSFYIAVCLPHDKELSPLDITAMGWLGTNVKKTILMCSVDSDDKVSYVSLQWTGLS